MIVAQDAFALFDKSKTGFLTKHEFKCAIIYAIGIKPQFDVFKGLWRKYSTERYVKLPSNDLPTLQKGIDIINFELAINELPKSSQGTLVLNTV